MRVTIKGSTKWPMFLSVFLTLRKNQERAMSKSLPIIIIRKKRRKYYYVSSTSDSWSNDLDCQQFDKRQKTKKKRGSNEQKQGNRKKEKTLVNSHATLTARLTVQ